MRFRTAALIVAGLALLFTPAPTAEAQGRPQPSGTFDCQRVLADYFDSLPVNVLDQETIDMVTLLREEEKLARDVYLSLTALYSIQIWHAPPQPGDPRWREGAGAILLRCGRGGTPHEELLDQDRHADR